jgi:signal transduction histidine kinase
MADFEDDRAICREYIRSAQKEVASAARIVSNTLKFTRRAEDATREKLSDILDSALTLLDAKRKRAAITVERDYRPQAELLCLSSELRQVFANLLTNAFEASFDNAKVHVRARNSAHWHTGHPGVRLTIADNGSGMSPDTKKNLYQAFYTTKGTNGTGLGLWVSHEILARHGATLQVRSRQAPHHSGTVLQLFFPVDTQPKTTATPTTQAQPKASATT